MEPVLLSAKSLNPNPNPNPDTNPNAMLAGLPAGFTSLRLLLPIEYSIYSTIYIYYMGHDWISLFVLFIEHADVSPKLGPKP